MRIHANVKLQGERNEIIMKALIDTGAEISLMPRRIAVHIGAWPTYLQTSVVGVHREVRTLPIIVAHLYFPELDHIGGQFAFVMSDAGQELIVGMDILRPLGIIVDTGTDQLSVKNEIREAFKTLATTGVLFLGGIKLLEALSEQND